MISLFTTISSMLEASMVLALIGAFVWGILSVLLSPCHLAGIPLIVGFINDQRNGSTRNAIALSTLFALGILATIAGIGLVTGLMGKLLGDLGGFGRYFPAAMFLLFGLYLIGVLPLPFGGTSLPGKVHIRGPFAALILGLLFGIALGPCSFAFLAPVIGVAFQAAATNLAFSIGLFLAYAVGHCAVLILAGSFSELVRQYLKWDERSRGTLWIKRVCGALLIAGSLYSLFLGIR
ncbi:MAG: cytochrome C biogenesis protein [Spirochaeta sp.]|nr:cytochrome C biogenesis protein [Spirochaeta sp.]